MNCEHKFYNIEYYADGDIGNVDLSFTCFKCGITLTKMYELKIAELESKLAAANSLIETQNETIEAIREYDRYLRDCSEEFYFKELAAANAKIKELTRQLRPKCNCEKCTGFDIEQYYTEEDGTEHE